MGIREVSLIGGEAFLRKDWLELAEAITRSGMVATMTTGGYGINAETAHKMKAAGIKAVSVSVDGLEGTHNGLRGRPQSFQFCLETMTHLKEAGILVGCNTQINRLSAPELPELYGILRDRGMRAAGTPSLRPHSDRAASAMLSSPWLRSTNTPARLLRRWSFAASQAWGWLNWITSKDAVAVRRATTRRYSRGSSMR